jgi:hypothetical protein
MRSVLTRLWLILVIAPDGSFREGARVSGIERGLVPNCISGVQSSDNMYIALEIIHSPIHHVKRFE